MHFERWVFAQALMDYFAREAKTPATPAEIVAALGLNVEGYRRAQAHHEARLMDGIARQDLVLATQFAEIFTRARAHLRATRPSLEDLSESTRLAAPLAPPVVTSGVDETALLPVHVPNVVVPFGGPAPAPRAPEAHAPSQVQERAPQPVIAPPVPPAGIDETVIAPALAPSKALPFAPASVDGDPKKGRR